MHFHDELRGSNHLLPIWQRTRKLSSHCRCVNKGYRIAFMRRRPRHMAPDSFINLLWERMKSRGISLNQLAHRAKVSPAFLSRILNRERGLPSDQTILRLARELDLQPPEFLLIQAGRIPEELKPSLSRPQMPEFLRATGRLSETEFQEVVKTVQALALKKHREKKRT